MATQSNGVQCETANNAFRVDSGRVVARVAPAKPYPSQEGVFDSGPSYLIRLLMIGFLMLCATVLGGLIRIYYTD